MKPVRFLLACLWLIFGVATTAHAGMPAPGLVSGPMSESPCHMSAPEMARMPGHSKPAPHSDQGPMPCCSQPAMLTPCEVAVPAGVRVQRLRLSPAPARSLTGLQVPFEPHPPKAV